MKIELLTEFVNVAFEHNFKRHNPLGLLDKAPPEYFVSHGKSWNKIRDGLPPGISFDSLVEVFVEGSGPAGTNFMCNFYWESLPRITAWRFNEIRGWRKSFLKKVEQDCCPPFTSGWYTPISTPPEGLEIRSSNDAQKSRGPFWTLTPSNLWVREADKSKFRALVAVEEEPQSSD
jgi:hypothetical protein